MYLAGSDGTRKAIAVSQSPSPAAGAQSGAGAPQTGATAPSPLKPIPLSPHTPGPARPAAAQSADAQPAAAQPAHPVARPVQPTPAQPAQPVARAVTPLAATALPAAAPPGQPPVPAQPMRAAYPPPAPAARPRFRHWMLLVSFLLLVVLPLAAGAWYLWMRAQDQYVSTMAFSVRKEDQKTGIDILGGFSAFTSSGGASDQNILYDYIRSPDMVREVGKTLDLERMFSGGWPRDFVYAYKPGGTIEDLVDFWNRQVRVLSDDKTGIITVKVAAFSPQDSKAIADAVFAASSAMVNALSDQARDDATRYAKAELDKAQQRVDDVRRQMTDYRTRTQLVDPRAEFESRMGILTQLQGQLAGALVSQDLLTENGARDNDPRVDQGKKRIAAIEARIKEERDRFSTAGEGPGGESYARLVAEYEQLTADRTFAETTFTAARATYDKALAEAQRQNRYLAAHIVPHMPEQSLRPDRPLVFALFGAFLLLGWGILLLIYYSVRDRA